MADVFCRDKCIFLATNAIPLKPERSEGFNDGMSDQNNTFVETEIWI